jgi:hypothetical protein
MLHPSQILCASTVAKKLAPDAPRLEILGIQIRIDRGLQPAILLAVSARQIDWLNERWYDVHRAPNIIEPKKNRAALDLLPTRGLEITL